MIVKLWYEQILQGKKTFGQVPAKLKTQVADMLRENGHDDLIKE